MSDRENCARKYMTPKGIKELMLEPPYLNGTVKGIRCATILFADSCSPSSIWRVNLREVVPSAAETGHQKPQQ